MSERAGELSLAFTALGVALLLAAAVTWYPHERIAEERSRHSEGWRVSLSDFGDGRDGPLAINGFVLCTGDSPVLAEGETEPSPHGPAESTAEDQGPR